MSDTMRDAAWKLVPVEPSEQMIEAGINVKRMRLLDSVKAIREGRDPEELMGKTAGAEYRAMLEAAPAPPVPSSVQEIMPLVNAYVAACIGFAIPKHNRDHLDDAAKVQAAFAPIEAALTALVEKNHELQFSLDGVNAMRRPDESVAPEELAEQYIANLINRSPDPLRELGDYLGRVLDEDEWPTAEGYVLAAMKAAMRGPEWISVDERLPDVGTQVLTLNTIFKHHPTVVQQALGDDKDDGLFWDETGDRATGDYIRHWQPLLPPPTPGIEPEQGGNHGNS